MKISSPPSPYRASLRGMWNEWVLINAVGPSEYYDVEAFLAGGLALDAIERKTVDEVGGKRLLHSQCHFGLTSLSWVRLGAQVTRPYFSVAEPMRFEVQGSYANPSAPTTHKIGYAWAHPLASVMGALLGAGLTIERFEEYDHCAWPKFRAMRKEASSVWRLPDTGPRLPLMYSLRARKPGPAGVLP